VRVRLGRVISDELIRSSGNTSLKAADVRGFCFIGRRRVRTNGSFLMRNMENRVDGMQRTCGAPVFVMFLAFAFAANLGAQTPADAPHGEAQSQTVPATAQGQADDYAIGPDDVLNVYILDVPELSREYRVSSTGTVTVPLLSNPLTAQGLTLSQFSDRLTQELKAAGLVSDPHVVTSVGQSRLHTVAITGAVKRPQIYTVFSQTTLLDVLSQAEGLESDAGNTAVVHRGDVATHALGLDSGKALTAEQLEAARTVSVDLKRLLDGVEPKLNLDVYPGDRITVPRAGVVYVVGAVNKPGGFTMAATSRGITVLQALALAEDTKSTALRDKSLIIRRDPQSPEGRAQIPVDLKKILGGKSPDPSLQAEDILFVPDSSGKRALHRGLESILQVTSGVVIYSSRF
jgi:polysaccharide export outer membrane protein